MEDFRNSNENGITRLPREIAPTPVPNEYGGIYDKPKAPKIGFFKARMNKDNFWNLMFAAGISFGWLISLIVTRLYLPLGLIGAFLTIIIASIIVRMNSKISFTEDKKFLNTEGYDVTDRIPSNLLVPILLAFGSTSLIGSMLSKDAFSSPLIMSVIYLFILFSTFFFSFALYFILINCPISVLFNLDVWKQKRDLNASYQHLHKSPFNSSHDNSYSPSKSYLPSNCYHRS